MRLLVQVLDPGVPVPSYAHEDDAGLDLRSTVDLTLGPGDRHVVPTGLAVEVPRGYVGLVCPRSGLAAQHGITVANAPGIVDSGYRGEVGVILVNLDRHGEYEVRRGDRIAQLIIIAVGGASLEVVSELSPSHRGTRGFGQSGR